MAREAHKDCQAPLEPLALKDPQVLKVFQAGKDQLDLQDKLAHQEEAFLMETSEEYVKGFLITSFLSLSTNCEDLKVCLDKVLLDRQESQERRDHQAYLDQLEHPESGVSWAYLVTKDLKDCKDQGESLDQKEPKEPMVLAYQDLKAFLARRESKDRLERARLELMDHKGRQDQEDILASAARMALLGLWVHASNVLQ